MHVDMILERNFIDTYYIQEYETQLRNQLFCIISNIVKDMSRFGRDYIMVGYYTEIYFSNLDIRFIAINDNVDSDIQTENDLTPFKNVFNEWYAKDTLKKIRSVFKAEVYPHVPDAMAILQTPKPMDGSRFC